MGDGQWATGDGRPAACGLLSATAAKLSQPFINFIYELIHIAGFMRSGERAPRLHYNLLLYDFLGTEPRVRSLARSRGLRARPYRYATPSPPAAENGKWWMGRSGRGRHGGNEMVTSYGGAAHSNTES